MKQKFKSKIGFELMLPIAGVFAIVISFASSSGHGWSMLGILSPVILFIAPMFFGTSYTITGNNLEIRCGLFYYKKIAIAQIYKIRASRSWLSAPAVSLDRLEIFYDKYDSVLISPKDKQRFINELLKIEPTIDVELKTT